MASTCSFATGQRVVLPKAGRNVTQRVGLRSVYLVLVGFGGSPATE
jgi:hypothetical protein